MKYKYKGKKEIELQVYHKSLVVKVNGNKYSAEYGFLTQMGMSLQSVPKAYYDLLMFILFYDLETIDIDSSFTDLSGCDQTIISYSGGVDSTALLSFGGIPVHITRVYQPMYEQKQIKAVEYIDAYQVHTNFEKIRELYIGKHGFNVGVGYAALYIPLLPLFKANRISLGVVFDDLAFNFGDPFSYNTDFTHTRLYKIREKLRTKEIDIVLPLAGYSEVLTTRITNSGPYKHFSSCHTPGDEQKCLQCIKCFRKEGAMGRKIPLNTATAKRKIMPFFKKYPLKMAAVTVYAIQKAGYKGKFWQRYQDIDVSFCERVNRTLTEQFYDGSKLPGFSWQTSEDAERIKRFVDFINDRRIYR